MKKIFFTTIFTLALIAANAQTDPRRNGTLRDTVIPEPGMTTDPTTGTDPRTGSDPRRDDSRLYNDTPARNGKLVNAQRDAGVSTDQPVTGRNSVRNGRSQRSKTAATSSSSSSSANSKASAGKADVKTGGSSTTTGNNRNP